MKICLIENCNRSVRARGLCGSHYQKSIAKPYIPKPDARTYSTRHYLTEIDEDSKLASCSICGPNTEIYVRSNARYSCRSVELSYAAKRRVRKPSVAGAKHRYYYGDGDLIATSVAVEAIARLRIAQDSKCAICRKDELEAGTLCLDHCHKTGEIRGLLCRKCNTGIGLLGDNLDGLKAATEYLTR